MIQAVIVIELISGNKIKYVRDVLATKTGNDGATIPTNKFAGEPTKYYAYTGDGNDTYSDQTGSAGLILADLTSLETSLLDTSTAFLEFPESGGNTDELIRYNTEQKTGRRTNIVSKILKDKVQRIYVEEVWTSGNEEPSSRDTLPKWSPRYMADGWNEDRNGPFTFPNPTAKTLFAPTILSSTSTGNSITITWANNPDYSSYNMYLNDKQIASGVSALTYTFTGLKAGVRYTVGVCGVSGDKLGPVSYIEKTTTMTSPVLSHTENDYSIDVSWTAVPEAVFYRVYLDDVLIKNNLIDLEYQIDNLTPDTEYTVRVDAVGEFSDNTSTASFTATTNAIAPTNAPTITSIQDSTVDSITINWTNLKTGYRYNIYQDGVLIDTTLANVTTYTYSGLNSETEYDLSIAALNTDNTEGPVSNVITKSTQMAVPELSVADVAATTLTLNWTETVPGYTYNVYQDGVLIEEGLEVLTLDVTDLTADTEYTFSVGAVNTLGVESALDSKTVKTLTT